MVGSLAVELDWSTEVGEMNLDLEVFDPADNTWATPSNLLTWTLLHGGDSPLSDSGTEIVNSQGMVAAGTYQVYLRVIETDSTGGFLMFADIPISTHTTGPEFGVLEFDTPPANNTLIQIADIDFPAGTITWYIPTFP
jgi:hypothetical protein